MDFDLTARPEGDQDRRARAARGALAVGEGARGGRSAASTTTRCGASSAELGWPGIAVGRGARRPGARRGRAGRAARGARLRLRGDAVPLDRRRRLRDPGLRHRRAARAPPARARLRRGDRRRRDARAVRRRRGRRRARAARRRRAPSWSRAPTPSRSDVIDSTRRYATVTGGDGRAARPGRRRPRARRAWRPRSSASASRRST